MPEALKKGIGSRYMLPILGAYAAGAALLGLNGASPVESVARHLMAAGLAGVLILVLQELLPRAAKEIIVFWRLRDRLPGCRAFTMIAKEDQRFDQTELAVLLPHQPMTATEQNALWYRWLKEVENDPGIADNHRRWLALRESTVLLLMLALVSPLLALLPSRNWLGALWLSVSCTLAYLVTMFATRNSAERLVSNVVALKVAKS